MRPHYRLSELELAGLLKGTWIPTVILLLSSISSSAQSPTPQTPPASRPSPQTGEQSLVEGLLDLIDKPGTSTGSGPNSAPPELGSDLNSSNPLMSVREQMKVAAGLLQRGRGDQQTVDLQSKIVSELDALIKQLEQQRSSSSASDQRLQQMHQNTRPSQSQRSSSTQPKESTTSPASPTQAPSSESGDQPGDTGDSITGQVQRNDPVALQQNVWGHLPDRVRSQMQSRMVEEFLPSYRNQIEAYYRALLDNGGKR